MMRLPLICGRIDRDHSIVGFTLVDDEDYEWAQRYVWHLNVGGYADRRRPRPLRGSVLLHREILGLQPSDPNVGDHINRDTLDNRRKNLRILDRQHHNHNMASHADSRYSKHRGVSFRPDRGKWRAYGQLNYKWVHLGYFDSERTAASAAKRWRLEHMSAAVD